MLVRAHADEVSELDGLALGRSTLDSPRFKRAFFATLFGFVMVVHRALMVLTGAAREAARVGD